MKASKYLEQLSDINSNIEIDIFKILNKNKTINNVFEKPISIGTDVNGVRCILYDDKPLREYSVETNVNILEEIENNIY